MEPDRVCRTCGEGEDVLRLEKCGICAKFFCPPHAHRAFGGRKFCSVECARGYYFHGEMEDDDDEGFGREDQE
jgi:hypothetical protein